MKNLFRNRFALTEQGAKDLIKSSGASFLTYGVNVIPIILLMFFFDQLLFSHFRSNEFFYILSGGVLTVMYLALNFEYHALFNATYKESENMRIDIARRLSNLPISYFSKHDLADLAQTIMGDVAGLEHALSHAIAKLVGFIAFLGVIAVMLLGGNVKLGLCVLLPIFLYFAALLLSKKMQVANNLKYYKKLRENADGFQEAIELQQEIKSFGMSDEIKGKLYQQVRDGEKIHIRAEFGGATVIALAGVILYLAHVLVIVLGTALFIKGEISLLYLIGYLLAAMKLKDATEGIGMNMAELFYIDAMIKRIKEIRNTEVQGGEDYQLTDYDIQLKDVVFSYDEDAQVLKGVSFEAKQNEVTALVGKSGCGKTSILRLISRLYDCDEGLITVSGKDIKEISTKSLFSKVSIVFQDVTLFNASVLENIRIGRIDATDEEVKQAARLANCEEFIHKLANGYETKIGENGASLSGGERQRLSIARAFLKDAPIIILDEIAAALDVDNEMKIQESLNKLTKNKTVLIISHRLKSIENVDKIVVIDDGRVEKIGRHQELMGTSQIYADLVHKTKLAEGFKY